MNSVASGLFIPDFFVTQPEYGYFVKQSDQFSDDLVFTKEQAKVLLNEDRSDPRTLLNPDNMRAFLDYRDNGLYSQILNRFKLVSEDQAEALYAYIQHAV